MRVVMQMKWDGIKPAQYESLRKSVNWEGNTPDGAVFHVSAFDKNAIHVTDIWESEKQFNSFVEKRLMPEVKKLGINNQPQVTFYPVHAIFNPVLETVS